VGPQGATTLRLGFSALILAAVQRPWRDFRLHRPVGPLIAYGLCLGSMNTLFYMALRTVPLGIAVALEFIGPLSVAALSTRRWADLVWIVLAVIGLALLLPLRRSVHAVDPAGAVLALVSGAFWALYILFGRRVGQTYGTRGTALGMIIAAAIFVPLGLARTGPAVFAPALLPGGVLLALLSSAVPYSLEMAALARIPPRAFGTLMSLEPAVGALAGLAMLGERLTSLQWAGVAAVIVASLGTTLAARPET
jgi:inner membrane transporter RhtA